VLQHVLQLAQPGRAWHPDCVCDLLGCESLTTQRSRPQSPRYGGEFSKRGYVRSEDAGNQQTLELLCGISQDQPFLPTSSGRIGLGELHFSVEAQDIEAPGLAHVVERHRTLYSSAARRAISFDRADTRII
jgi:hypothetical protein